MRKVADTKETRKITLEFSQGELEYIIAACCHIAPYDIHKAATDFQFYRNTRAHVPDGHAFAAAMKDALRA